jgi:2-polyprenyl-6-methoxyphenol hydroxylase-like FAD-dependent oxidoreductase
MRAILRSAMILAVAVSAAGAQSSTARPLPAGSRICDMSMRIISMRLVDSSGAPVPGASITVRRVRTRALLAQAEAMGGQGDYKILEDGTLTDLRRGGEPFEVRFTKNSRTRRVRLIIGMDPGGCHVTLKSGPTTVTM